MNKIQEGISVALGLVGSAMSITDITNIINLLLLIASLANIIIVLILNIRKHIRNGEYDKIPEEIEKTQNQLEQLNDKINKNDGESTEHK